MRKRLLKRSWRMEGSQLSTKTPPRKKLPGRNIIILLRARKNGGLGVLEEREDPGAIHVDQGREDLDQDDQGLDGVVLELLNIKGTDREIAQKTEKPRKMAKLDQVNPTLSQSNRSLLRKGEESVTTLKVMKVLHGIKADQI